MYPSLVLYSSLLRPLVSTKMLYMLKYYYYYNGGAGGVNKTKVVDNCERKKRSELVLRLSLQALSA